MADQDREVAGAERASRPEGGPRSISQRLGEALIAPVRALAAADRDPGRTSGDAAILLVLYFAAVHTDTLVSAGWQLLGGEVGLGLQTLVRQLAQTITAPLVFLFGGGMILTLVAGKRRSLGADFDLACVALVPLLVVHAAGWVLVRIADAGLPATLHDTVNVIGYGWAFTLLVLGIRQARSRGRAEREEAS